MGACLSEAGPLTSLNTLVIYNFLQLSSKWQDCAKMLNHHLETLKLILWHPSQLSDCVANGYYLLSNLVAQIL